MAVRQRRLAVAATGRLTSAQRRRAGRWWLRRHGWPSFVIGGGLAGSMRSTEFIVGRSRATVERHCRIAEDAQPGAARAAGRSGNSGACLRKALSCREDVRCSLSVRWGVRIPGQVRRSRRSPCPSPWRRRDPRATSGSRDRTRWAGGRTRAGFRRSTARIVIRRPHVVTDTPARAEPGSPERTDPNVPTPGRQRLGVYLVLDAAPRDEVAQLSCGELHLHRHDIIHG